MTDGAEDRDSSLFSLGKLPLTGNRSALLRCPACQTNLTNVVADGQELPDMYRCWECESVWSIEEVSVLPDGRKPFGEV